MQDLSHLRKKDTIEIHTRFISPLIAGSITLVGLVFALGVMVGNKNSRMDTQCTKVDLLTRLNEQAGETVPSEEMDETSFYKRLDEESPRIPVPASLKSVSGHSFSSTDAISEKEELKRVAVEEPTAEETPVPEKIRDDEAEIFTLQVGSFQDKREASLMARRLKRAGHKSFLVRVSMPDQGGDWFRVRIGPFTSKKQAWSYKNEFETKERLPAFVVKRRG
jgi:cell division septation protein DedD